MNEVEVKILDISRTEIITKLESLGAQRTFDGEMEAVIFDFEGEPINQKKNVLRLRKEGDKVTFTYKHFKGDEEAKIHHELEVEVSNFDTMKEILESLGLQEVQRRSKHRIEYKLDQVHFVIDKFTDENSFIPEFLEIEGTDVESVYKAAELLGFSKEDCKAWDQGRVVRYYRDL